MTFSEREAVLESVDFGTSPVDLKPAAPEKVSLEPGREDIVVILSPEAARKFIGAKIYVPAPPGFPPPLRNRVAELELTVRRIATASSGSASGRHHHGGHSKKIRRS